MSPYFSSLSRVLWVGFRPKETSATSVTSVSYAIMLQVSCSDYHSDRCMTGRDTKKLTLRTDLFVTFLFREACSSRNGKCLNDCHERARSFECGRQQSVQKAPLRPRLHLSIDWRLHHLTGRHPIIKEGTCLSFCAFHP